MVKAKTKQVTLRGITRFSNADVALFMQNVFGASIMSSAFKLTQKPRVQVVQAPKVKR